MPQLSFHSPISALTITEEDGRIIALDWGWAAQTSTTPLLREAKNQLDAYFAQELKSFDLPLDPPGTIFYKRAWAMLETIPWGQTCSYGALAARLNTSPRAVGLACRHNPIPLLIPCHRVITYSKTLGGYSGIEGQTTKAFLLRLENANGVIFPSLLSGLPP